MFNFIKKLFEKEEVFSEEEANADELEEWLNSKLSGIDFKEEIVEFLNKIKDKKWVLGEKVDILSKAEIDEKEKERVEGKVKSIVLGHKDHYVKEMKRFVDSLEVPEKPDLQEVVSFNSILDKRLGELANRTAKSYQAAQHLFFKPVEDVFKGVGEINLLVKSFDKKLENKGFKRVNEIQEKIKYLQEEKKKRERLEDDLKWREKKLERCLEGNEKQEEEIGKLRGSEEYKELKILKEEEEEIKSLVGDNKDEVHLFFSKLGRALRKYEKVTLEVKIVKDYLGDAVKAFFSDNELKVVGVLEGLGKSLNKGEVRLDEKQKENALELVEKAKKGYLKGILEEGKKLQQRVEGVKAKLRRYNVDKLIEEAEYKLEHFEDQIVLVGREKEELKVKLQALGEEKIKEELKELIKEVLKVEIKLV